MFDSVSLEKWRHPSWWNLLIVVPWALGSAWLIHEFTVERAVAGREKTAPGTITAHEPANHNQYGYAFSVNGKTYSGRDGAEKQAPRIGKQVLVYYDPHNPAMNALTSFAELEGQSIGPVLFMFLGIVGVTIFIVQRRRDSRGAPDRNAK